jgi:acyl-CoA reductase-like NAD-dependent aldehyde dehydrogenase
MTGPGNYTKLFIDGAWVTPATTEVIEVVSPATEAVIARVPAASNADVDRAVEAARRAFDEGPWPRLSLDERIEALERLSVAVTARLEELAQTITAEMGCPITQSRTFQATRSRDRLDSFIALARDYPFSSVRTSATANALVTREPLGVVAAVVPWNVPQATTMLKLPPALLAGCTVVLKPSPETPLDSYLIAEAIIEAGLPPGVVNIVPAHREVSEHLVTHAGVDKVSFTGSTAAGRRIAALCGGDLRRVTLELGGKSAAVILDDADLEMTVRSLRAASLPNSGQICSAKTRIVVSCGQQDELLERLSEMMASMPVGDPGNAETEIGPMVSSRQRERVEGYIQAGRQAGAKVVLGGGRPAGLGQGWYVEPTLFADVDPAMTIAQEEIFGPVLAVTAYDKDEEAIAIANNSRYGLNGAVFSSDPERALRVASRIRTGTVEINGQPAGMQSPAGGFKESGIGREGGPEGFDAYVETRSISLPAELMQARESVMS